MSKLLDLPPEIASREQFGIFSDFKSLPRKMLHTYRLADLDANADLSASVIWAPGMDVYVHAVYIVPDGSAAGVDDSNTSVWNVSDGTTAMVTKTFNTSNAFPADNVQNTLGTVTKNVIASDGRVELTVTNGTTANTVATEVTVVYSPLEGFPEHGWKVIATDDGSGTISDAAKGLLSLTPSDTTVADNDEIYLCSQAEIFKLAADCPILAQCLIQYSEANTDDANVAFGLADAVAANLIVDDGAGMKTSGEMIAIYKVDGGTVWKVVTSHSSTQTISTSTKTAGGSSYQTLQIEVVPQQGSIAECTFKVDGTYLIDSTTLKPIKHRIDFSTSPTDMQLFVGLKQGSANAETLLVDYAGAWQRRS